MGHTSKAKKRRKKDAAIIAQGFIKLPEGEKNINQTDIDRMAQIDYPLFSFKHLQKVSFDGDVKAKFFQDFLLRLKKYSDLGWKQMATEKRHDYGWEYLPQDRMKNKLPAAVTPKVCRVRNKYLSLHRKSVSGKPRCTHLHYKKD